MNDLRHDQEAADERTHYNLKAVKPPVKAMTEHDLRTVSMPDLRSPQAREQDAQVRGLHYLRYPDTRTENEKVVAELVRLVDAVQALRLEFDLLREDLKAGRL